MRFVLLLVCLSFLSPAGHARENLPFWTEKSTYTEGDRIYAVGVSSPTKDLAQARQAAFEAARTELSNMLQLSDLGELTLNTQRTFETNRNGKYVVYRLIWVEAEKAMELKETAAARTKELLERQASHMEKYVQEMEPVLERYRQAEASLEEVESKARELAAKWDERRKKIRTAARAIERKIASRSNLVCEIKQWMTEDEVLALIGPPDSRSATEGGSVQWHYGGSRIVVVDGKVATVPRRRCD